MSVSFLDNFLDQNLVNDIETIATDIEFPWFWRSSTTYGESELGKQHKDFQFVHLMYYDDEVKSTVFGLAQHLLFQFEDKTNLRIKNVKKIKANLTVQSSLSEQDLEPAIHTDCPKDVTNYLSIIYYVMDSDGDTVFFDDDKNEIMRKPPVKGTCVYFPSNMWHRHTPPKDNKRRIVFNIVVELQ